MNSGLKARARSALLEGDLYLAKATPVPKIQDLISKLRPKDCGIDLIRVGGEADGGYLLPDDLEGIEYCFSPGVSTVSSFEDQLADRKIKSFLADYSVDAPTVIRPEFTFDKKFVGSSDRDHFMTLATWKDKYLSNYAGELILQMDIEGSEYEVIANASDQLLDQFRIIVIEFHHLDRLFDSLVFDWFASCFEKVLKSFHVVHIHPNNRGEAFAKGNIVVPQLMEFTFLNKRRAKRVTNALSFPHRLDSDNTSRRPLPLPPCWYS